MCKIIILFYIFICINANELDISENAIDNDVVGTSGGFSSMLTPTDIMMSKTILTDSGLQIYGKVWNITFNLFTSNNPTKLTVLNFLSDDNAIINSGFEPHFRTKFIIHGFLSGYRKAGWMNETKDYILGKIRANVICVDWSVPAANINYAEVFPKVGIVGQMIANFIRRLTRLMNTSTNDMHCIGHSLGAHTCGHTGKALGSNKLNQISGFDPAWPGFDKKAFSFLADTSLDPLNASDANLVLVIHTSAGVNSSGDMNVVGLVGNPNNLGHYDFRINGGNIQPMCRQVDRTLSAVKGVLFEMKSVGDAVKGVSEAYICPHESSHIYPISKPHNGCKFIAFKCSNYNDFQNGKCIDGGMPLEFNFDYYEDPYKRLNETTLPNDLFIITGDSKPFCVFHYQIVIKTENKVSVDETVIKFIGKTNFEISMKFWPRGVNNTYTFLHTEKDEMGVIEKVTYVKNGVTINSIFINYMSDLDDRIRRQKSYQVKSVAVEKGNVLLNVINWWGRR